MLRDFDPWPHRLHGDLCPQTILEGSSVGSNMGLRFFRGPPQCFRFSLQNSPNKGAPSKKTPIFPFNWMPSRVPYSSHFLHFACAFLFLIESRKPPLKRVPRKGEFICGKKGANSQTLQFLLYEKRTLQVKVAIKAMTKPQGSHWYLALCSFFRGTRHLPNPLRISII